MLKTDAWKALSAPARAIYVQIGFRYNGKNNGKIAYSAREAASECRLNKDTAARTFKELIALGFIEETRHGGLSRKTRVASEWRLTAFRCDLTGALKTSLFMQRGTLARGIRLSENRGHACPKIGRFSVRNEGTACPKHRGQAPLKRHSPKQGSNRSGRFGGVACPKQGDTYNIPGRGPIRDSRAGPRRRRPDAHAAQRKKIRSQAQRAQR